LGAADRPADIGRLMATVTYVRTLDYVATMLGEDVELLEAIVSNHDNLTYGAIISVYTGPDEAITALTDHGLEELTDMLSEARLTTKTWHQFLDDFVDDPELAARSKARALR
jgi:hypothetical protein